MEKILKDKKVAALIIVAIVAIALIGVFLIINSEKFNESQAGEGLAKVQFIEEFKPIDSTSSEFEYVLKVVNEDNRKDYYARVKVNTGLSGDKEDAWITNHLNKSWEYDGDFCYYKGELKSEVTSEPLFNNVILNDIFILGESGKTIYIESSGFVEADKSVNPKDAF